MPLKTKRWNDPPSADDGLRLLVCRLRPRGVPTAGQPWDAWWPELGPSRELLDEFHGKGTRHTPLPWPQYRRRYLAEMSQPAAVWRLRDLARRLASGERLTLLRSSACVDPRRCHRTLLAGVLSKADAP